MGMKLSLKRRTNERRKEEQVQFFRIYFNKHLFYLDLSKSDQYIYYLLYSEDSYSKKRTKVEAYLEEGSGKLDPQVQDLMSVLTYVYDLSTDKQKGKTSDVEDQFLDYFYVILKSSNNKKNVERINDFKELVDAGDDYEFDLLDWLEMLNDFKNKVPE